mgnify:CR=1 FL=1
MKEVKMVDITKKDIIYREATAIGRIKLRKETIEKIVRGEIEKGDVISASKLVAIIAVKRTPELLPLCHPIQITSVNVDIYPIQNGLEVKVTVKATAKTGVEMEALAGVSAALLNIWDMVKKYEKDEKGQYPYTEIYGIRVISKIKREVSE